MNSPARYVGAEIKNHAPQGRREGGAREESDLCVCASRPGVSTASRWRVAGAITIALCTTPTTTTTTYLGRQPSSPNSSYQYSNYLLAPSCYSLGENTMLSCHSTKISVTASAADAYAGPRARVCEIMGFDQGVFPLMSQDASTATTSADVKK